MVKFKVGDKVRVVRNNGDDFDGIKIGDTGEVVEICKGKYPIYLKINNHAQYAFKEEELELYDEYFVGGNKMELTFKEVIANIKENEVWESNTRTIERQEGGINIKRKSKVTTYYMYFDDNEKFKLQRKEYTFEEAFKAYEEGKEIESDYSGGRYKKEKGKDTFMFLADWREFDSIDLEEIRGKWYIND